ncbi:hypothetical protein ACFL1G_06335 [Planctomycetota bacterium]
MKKIFLVMAFSFLLFVCGCSDKSKEQDSSGDQSQTDETAAPADIETAEEPNGFPESLVGTWIANKSSWEFVFEPDGMISSAVIDYGKVRVDPRQRVTEAVFRYGKGVYQMGECEVDYSESSNELAVVIAVDSFRIDRPDVNMVMEGSSEDWFTGSVSDDHKSWTARWFSFPRISVNRLEDGKGETLELEIDPNDIPPVNLIFRKKQ